MRPSAFLFCFSLITTFALGQQSKKTAAGNDLKEAALKDIAGKHDQYRDIALQIWNYAA